MEPRIRHAAIEDEPRLYEICVLTGDSGQDAITLLDEPGILGDLFVGPYLMYELGLAMVVEDDEGVGGYILGTKDTECFQARCRSDWWPMVCDRYANLRGASVFQRACLEYLHEMEAPQSPKEALRDYPAHLHINLLPRLQGRGLGRALMGAFLGHLRKMGSVGAHWGVWHENSGAMAFYRKMGAEVLAEEPWGLYFGSRLL